MIRLFVSSVLLAVPVGGPAAPPAYVLEKSEVQRIKGIYSCKVRLPRLAARGWVVFAARAPELPGQTEVQTVFEPEGVEVQELSPLRRHVLRAVLPVKDRDEPLVHEIKMRVTYEATLYGRKLRPLVPGENLPRIADLPETQRKLSLLSYGQIDHSKKSFRQWLQAQKLQRGSGEDDVAFARRVFVLIRSQFTYDYSVDMDRHASAVCTAGKSDCAGLSILFSAVLRANGIPARVLYGRWAASAKTDDKVKGVAYHQSHVIAEFHVQGIGWIPLDLATAIVHDKSKNGLTYFGNSPGNFLTIHVDPDFELNTVHLGTREAPSLQGPVYYVAGEGSMEPMAFSQDWQVSKVR